ncbi:hypothetical protein [Flavobacterium sp. PL002]|uniref:hypothetical protein n=1 Tax=Flavobacterium sp. PL002 TaxID=1897058 RepID=UPI001788108C|nr:hypothetical protein [Flavobacterium sp. PL002]MBE0393434.1 hypothetical protein [Flavobacterium sp. PL002]
MARQKGHIKYVGTLGEVRHFKIKGNEGYFAGLKGGPTAEQIKTAPGFIRTRENMSEFGACANAGKSVRVGLSSLMKQMSDSQLTGRLTAIMKKINIEDGSEARGQRAILISQQPQYLKGLDFNRNISFNGIFNAPYTFTPAASRIESTLSIDSFNPLNYLNIPSGATHFRIINAVSVVTGNYEPSDSVLNQMSNVAYSDYSAVDVATTLIEVTATLPGAPTLNTDVSVIGSMGIEFYQKVGNNYYLFNAGNALKIEDIF